MIECKLVQPGLAVMTLNRPERRNALCIELLTQLCAAVHELAHSGTARVLILQGAGPVFSAGLDLAEAADRNLVEHSAQCVADALRLMRTTPLVTIAAARGGAYAGGAGLLAACDMAIGSQDLKIGFPEARRGLLPALICEVLRNKVREGDLRELFLAGNIIDADRAKQIGILQRVVETDRLMTEATELAMDVLAGGPETIVATKHLLNAAFPHREDAHSSGEALKAHLAARQSPEAQEGLAAFLGKRHPRWIAKP
jgi:methylglutaconyl-CoA hydratase